jgi:hypothetical protein
MVCESICNCFGSMVDCVADEMKAFNKGVGDCFQRIGLPRDTLAKAAISFVASAALSGIIVACIGASPWLMLSFGTAAALASVIYAVAISVIRLCCKGDDMCWCGKLLLSTAVLLGSFFICSTFMPFIPTIGLIFLAIIATGIACAANGNCRVPLNKSAAYLIF